MTMSMTYPSSRIGNSGQCDQCKRSRGNMQDMGRLKLEDGTGTSIELMKWTCDQCGYTMLFDLGIARRRPWQGDDYTEILPD
ncbi:MAG: hypothetical protein QOH41_769 [Blastocatellia bacterium]|jgi:hypothetical protein|nr:hypothetical protein [Blastocatellia bacterium]